MVRASDFGEHGANGRVFYDVSTIPCSEEAVVFSQVFFFLLWAVESVDVSMSSFALLDHVLSAPSLISLIFFPGCLVVGLLLLFVELGVFVQDLFG